MFFNTERSNWYSGAKLATEENSPLLPIFPLIILTMAISRKMSDLKQINKHYSSNVSVCISYKIVIHGHNVLQT
jgi:hypothetical protein